MESHAMYYDKLIKLTGAISECKDPEEVALLTAESVKTVFNAKGCSVFLVNKDTRELGLAASFGLSQEYLNKGPVSSFHSIAASLKDGPVAIYDVSDDPRIQYPEAAEKEGIASILSVPIVVGGNVIGAMRVYTAEPWECTLEDVNFVQALAQMCGMLIEMCRLYQGQKEYIDVLTTMQEARDM